MLFAVTKRSLVPALVPEGIRLVDEDAALDQVKIKLVLLLRLLVNAVRKSGVMGVVLCSTLTSTVGPVGFEHRDPRHVEEVEHYLGDLLGLKD